MDKKEILKILESAKDKNADVPMKLVRQAFDKLPSAEPKIVYCKDCKHWYPDGDCGMACEFTNMSQPEDGYCNWGVKKDG